MDKWFPSSVLGLFGVACMNLASREPFHVRPFNIAETWMANASRQQGVFPRGLNNHRTCSFVVRLRVVIHVIHCIHVCGF